MQNLHIKEIKTAILLVIVTISVFAQNPLLIPPLLSGTSFNLEVKMDSTEFYPGHKTPTYGVNGNILGPTLIFNKWDLVTINVTNHINAVTTMHWHGLHVPAMEDGGPHQIINQGATWSPSFTIMNDAGTFWYHPHGEGRTDLQVSRGIAGFIIIKDSAEAALNLPRTYGVDDFPLVVQSKCFDVLYQVAIATEFDTVPMVNATMNAFLDAPAQVIRFRILNGSSNRSYLFGFSNNMNFHLIATDGGLIQAPVSMNRLRLSPGERAEVLLDLSSMQGQTIYLMNYGSQLPDGILGALNVGNGMAQIPGYSQNFLNGADFNLLAINVAAPTANPITTIPASLVSYIPMDTTLVNYHRTITFAPETMGMQQMVEGPFVLNGHRFSMFAINDTVYLNHKEVWTLNNQTLVAHPFHIHDVQFYITSVNGGLVPDYEQGKKDVVLVMPQQSVSFVTKFEDFTDTMPYMYHCHLLHHEDDGMMGSFIVLDSASVGMNEYLNSENVKIFPNPALGEYVNINSSQFYNREFKVSVSDFTGRVVIKSNIASEEGNLRLNISALSEGIYLLNIKSETFDYMTRMVIK